MPLGSRTTYELRSTGSALNSGGFDPGVATPGFDFSQQDTAAVVIDNSLITTSITANVITFTGYTPTANDDGNLVRMATGTNVTAGLYVITGHTPTTWTVSGAVNLPTAGTTTNATGRMGGANATLLTIQAILIDGNIVWIKTSGGYTTNTQWAPNGSITDGRFITIRGYTTTRGDNGLAVITASANLAPVLSVSALTIIQNLKIDGANTADRGIEFAGNCYMENVWVTRCNLSGVRAQNIGTRINRCLFTFNGASTGAGVGLDAGSGVVVRACEAHDNKQGFSSSNGTGDFEYCISHNNTASGFYQGGANGMRLRSCIANANAVDGLQINDTSGALTMEVTDCLFTNNGGRGIRSVATDYSAAVSAAMAAFFQNNAFYNNTGGNYSQVPAGAADVILTADPYTSAAGGDYSLNGTAGGGAATLGAGVPGGFGLLGTAALGSTGHLDIGAVQSLGAGPTSAVSTAMISLWRELAVEPSLVIPDSVPILYIDAGMEALNRRIRFHWTTDSSSIVFLAGTSEYVLPADLIEIRWLQWNGKELVKGSIDEWRTRGDDWKNEDPGLPQQWAIYSNRLVIRPVPSAAAVAVAASPVLRYCSKPPSVLTTGGDQLNSQDYRIPVYWGVAEYSASYPDSETAQIRTRYYMDRFDAEAQLIAQDYRDRALER